MNWFKRICQLNVTLGHMQEALKGDESATAEFEREMQRYRIGVCMIDGPATAAIVIAEWENWVAEHTAA